MVDYGITEKSRIKVYWDDRPENNTKENKNKVLNYFSKKYSVPKERIKVSFRPCKVNSDGELIPTEGFGVENVMDTQFQVKLFKEYFDREGYDITMLEDVLELDKIINSKITTQDFYERNKIWKIKNIELNNFLSYGENNKVDFTKLKGLNVINSLPGNQGGKCLMPDTQIVIKFNPEKIIEKLGFLPNELK